MRWVFLSSSIDSIAILTAGWRCPLAKTTGPEPGSGVPLRRRVRHKGRGAPSSLSSRMRKPARNKAPKREWATREDGGWNTGVGPEPTYDPWEKIPLKEKGTLLGWEQRSEERRRSTRQSWELSRKNAGTAGSSRLGMGPARIQVQLGWRSASIGVLRQIGLERGGDSYALRRLSPNRGVDLRHTVTSQRLVHR
jgi:hypothetical protein